ncbi:MAG: response regulator [Gemmatimonadaceae bacterium]|nr:response regulator [Gemmatimonadaceae bacterium]
MVDRPPDQGSGTILLIEDNEDNRAVYTTILRYYGYDVIEAPSAEDGIDVARRVHPALILMDIGLPGIDGWEATRRLKGDPQTRSIPIVALTAHALPEHRAESFAAGCDGYLAKPIEPRDVLAEVRRYLLDGPQLANRHT